MLLDSYWRCSFSFHVSCPLDAREREPDVHTRGSGPVISKVKGGRIEMSEMGKMIGGRNRLITIAIGLVVLAILNSVAYKMPEAGRFVTDWFSVGDILRLAILFIMMGLVLSARAPLTVLATYYARSGFKSKRPERVKVAQDVDRLAAEIANVVVIVVLWPIVTKIANAFLLLDEESAFYWVPIVVAVVFAALLLYRMYLGYTALRPVLDVVGVGSSKVHCPQCGTLNWSSAKFCISCGSDIQAGQTQEGESQSVRCPQCGAGNERGAKFCESCGASLSQE